MIIIQVPALEAKNGDALFESNAIAYYVANDQLRGKTALEQAQVVQWLSFSDNELLPSVLGWVFPTLNIIDVPKQQVERSQLDLQRALDVLNNVLLSKTYLVGERITLADIVVACSLLPAYQFVSTTRTQSAINNFFKGSRT